MNDNVIRIQELELAQHSLAIWGKINPELFTFDWQKDGNGTVRHG